jgi:hypothetical protein
VPFLAEFIEEIMNIKQIVSLVVVAIGISMIGYGFYSKTHISTAKAEIHKMAESKNPIVKTLGQQMESKIGRYRSIMNGCFLGGSILVVLGGTAFYYFRTTKRKK